MATLAIIWSYASFALLVCAATAAAMVGVFAIWDAVMGRE